MRSALTMAMLVATAAALFAAWMHPQVIDPRNVGWLLDGHDRGQSAIGLAAYLAGRAWPSLHNPILLAPDGTSLLLTDSIPLLGLVLGPFAGWMPPGLQFVGAWLAICVLLQVMFAWGLVRPHAPDGLAAWLGTILLAAMPMFFNRYGHASLCAQWLILWALWIYVDPGRAARPLWWLGALGVAALVHSYLLLMVASIWGGSLLRRVAQGAVARVLTEGVVLSALIALLLAGQGVFGGGFASTGTYGAFPVAIDAWWNPANPSYSAILPSSPEGRGRGYEGLQYLGAGLIALVLLALATRRGAVQSLGWLVPGFVALGLVAIGPQVIFWGEPVMTLALPTWLIDALDPVRASGRLSWPATYTLAYAAIISVLALPRAAVVLAAAAAVQVSDLAPMVAAIRATSARADDRTVFSRTIDPRWPALIAGAQRVDFTPAVPFVDLQLMEEITWRAVQAQRPVGFTYTARVPAGAKARLAAARAAFERGIVPTGDLVIVQDGKLPARLPPALRRRVQRIDGVTLIAAQQGR
ncbi:MAG: hypothetical protein C0476_01820 [Sphingomonas sp.]|nr:hypothetical protein [Sphingomonas sp.]